ncbi:MAG TPA: DNA internalization-related competence protein ComEC/Rec2 [Candidatus Hydrogenedens sp.]|nr:DNA internalization-related competence protein ComEC/Rec2 [Candidatus Hydrogenedens sp.]HPP59371.1 DNA internalization-related competence protein ComEC/Rec2 [Candidatus Hydrogenedens sp.]
MLINRHLVVACGGFVTGFILAEFQWINWYICVLTFILSLFLCFGKHRFQSYDEIWIFILFFSVGSITYLSNPFPKEGDALFQWLKQNPVNTRVEVEGYVVKNEPFNADSPELRFILQVLRVKNSRGTWTDMKGKMSVDCKNITHPIYVHTKLRVVGKPNIYLSPNNFSLYNYEDYLHSQMVFSKIQTSGKQLKILHEYHISPLFWISKLQQYLYGRFIKYSPSSTVDIAHAIWLGDRSGLSFEEKQQFVRTGTIHILAISGLHIGLLYWCIRKLWQIIVPFKEKGAGIFALIVCFLYTIMSGAHGSSLRALLMLSIYEIYVICKREGDILSSLSLTALLLFTFNPDCIRDVGTQMSFMAVASIILFDKPISKLFRFLPWTLRSYVTVVISAQILLLPLLMKFNTQVNFLSPLINLLVVPLVGIYLISSVGGVITIFLPGIPYLFFYSSSLSLLLIQWICSFGSSVSQTIIYLSHPTYIGVLVYFVTSYFLYRYLRTFKRRDLLFLLSSCVILWFTWSGLYLNKGGFVHLLDVGHGDAIVITTPEGEHLLFDSGTEDKGRAIVVPFLHAQGIRKLDYVIASHADEDHIGGLIPIIETYQVDNFLYGEGFETNPLGMELLERIKMIKCSILKLEAGKRIYLKKGWLDVLYAGKVAYIETNYNSVVVKFCYDNFTTLLTGDFPAEIAKKELQPDKFSAHILKLPHHGLKNSLNRDFLEMVKPQAVVISCNGFHRNFGMRAEIKELLEQYHVPYWRTDYHGGICIHFTLNDVSILGARHVKGYTLQPR